MSMSQICGPHSSLRRTPVVATSLRCSPRSALRAVGLGDHLQARAWPDPWHGSTHRSGLCHSFHEPRQK
jgi:hypothetical protein